MNDMFPAVVALVVLVDGLEISPVSLQEQYIEEHMRLTVARARTSSLNMIALVR